MTTAKSVDVYFDYASPWSYVAYATAERKLPGVELTWRPIYLRGLETFSKGLPYTAAKLSYLTRDLVRIAEHEKLELRPPVTFPIDGLHALRAAIVARSRDASAFERFHRAAFRATWFEQRDIADKRLVAGLLAEALGEGVTSVDALLEAMASPETKARLREDTAAAEARGVFGVPAFFVGDELYWGVDRMDWVLRHATT